MGKSGAEDLIAAILYYTKQEDDPRRGRQNSHANKWQTKENHGARYIQKFSGILYGI